MSNSIVNISNTVPILQQERSKITTNPFIPNEQKTIELEELDSLSNQIIEEQYNKNRTTSIANLSLKSISKNINKKSKESFDFSVFRINILLYVFDINMFIYLLNKIKNNILIDTNIKILLFYCNKLRLKKLNILLLNNFINCKYLKLLDIVGEINLKEKFYLNSSAVEHRTENPLVDSSNLSLDVYE